MCYYFDESAPLGSGQQQQQQNIDIFNLAVENQNQPNNNNNSNNSNNNNNNNNNLLDLPDYIFNLPPPDESYDLEQDTVLSQLMSDNEFLTNLIGENNNAATAAIDLMDRLEPLPLEVNSNKRKHNEISQPISSSNIEPATKKQRFNSVEIKPLMIDCKTNEKEDSHEEEDNSRKMKKRLVWTPELHERFVWAVEELGGANKASPKTIQVKMNVEGLTLQHIKSHLQKYRQQVRRSKNKTEPIKKSTVSTTNITPKIENHSSMLNAGITSGAVNRNKPMNFNDHTQHQIDSTSMMNKHQDLPSSLPHAADSDNELVRMILDRSLSEMVGRKISLTSDQYNLLYLGFSIGLKTGTPNDLRNALQNMSNPQGPPSSHMQSPSFRSSFPANGPSGFGFDTNNNSTF